MGTLKLSAELSALLSELSERTELVDQNGKLVGLFTPRGEADEDLEQLARRVFDLDEARRRSRSEKGHTTEEVLRHIKSLETSE